MFALIPAIPSAYCFYKAYAKTYDIEKIEQEKQKFEVNIISSDNLPDLHQLNYENVGPNGKFILQHQVPNFPNFYVVKLMVERFKTVKTVDSQPKTHPSFSVTPFGITIQEITAYNTVIREKEERYMDHQSTILSDTSFGFPTLASAPNFEIKLHSLNFFPVEKKYGSYGLVRDELKHRGINIDLSNVGNVEADIINCNNRPLYFSAKKVGTRMEYDLVSAKPQDISDQVFKNKFNNAYSTQFGWALGGIGLAAVSAIIACGSKN